MAHTHSLSFLLSILTVLISIQLAIAQSTTSTSPAPTSSTSITPTIAPVPSPWAYFGCYNETTQVNNTADLRALGGGSNEATQNMTVEACLAFCRIGAYIYAGLEYTKECWCASYLDGLSVKLDDSDCNMACIGNATEVCGGSLKLTVYKSSGSGSTGKSTGTLGREPVKLGSLLALGIAMGVLLWTA